MLKLCVLASGSSGNAMLVSTPQMKLLIDSGITGKELERRLQTVGEDAADIQAIFLTHEHSDHASGVGVMARRLRVPVYATQGTFEAVADGLGRIPLSETIRPGQEIRLGDLILCPFAVPHDAADPVALAVEIDGVKIGVATDLGYPTNLVRERLKECTILLLETNHDRDMLLVGNYPWPLKQRILGKHGHLSNDQACDLLAELLHPKLQVVLLGHLSEENNTPSLARSAMLNQLRQLGAEHIPVITTHREKASQPIFVADNQVCLAPCAV